METYKPKVSSITEQNLFRLLDMADASPTEKKQAKDEFILLILEQVIASIEKTLPEDKKTEYERVFKDDADPKERALFIQENVPDLEQRILEESVRFETALQVIAKQE